MSKDRFPRRYRALLTEVLPFELPMIFTNEFRYNVYTDNALDADLAQAMEKLRFPSAAKSMPYTVPYQYRIRKDRQGGTNLSLLHPTSQNQIAEFYDKYAETLLSNCALSTMSLRFPSKVAKIYSDSDLNKKSGQRDGVVHVEPEPDSQDISRIISFFIYREMNLLAKFYDSESYISLEKRFSRLRTLDISRCFYNIYTHSVTWAVKSKRFSKENANKFSFEQQFDRLMQRANYNETNGIVVGPEISRIFAEIILQRIDVELEQLLSSAQFNLRRGRDYDVRRYVDDYFIFSNDSETLDVVQGALEKVWEDYKLYLNEAKVQNLERPFVTALSTAKREIKRAIFGLKKTVDEVRIEKSPKKLRDLIKTVRSKTQETRLIIGEHGIGFHNVSSWCLAILKTMIFEMFGAIASLDFENEEELNLFERSIWSLFSLVFYVVSLDIRVSTIYSLGGLMTVMRSRGYTKLLAHSDWIDHLIEKEVVDLTIRSHAAFSKKPEGSDAIETLNLIILGAHYFGSRFAKNADVEDVVVSIMAGEVSYFQYISLKFLFLKKQSHFQNALDNLNLSAKNYVVERKRDLQVYAEPYLILCDLLSAPDLTYEEKRDLWKLVHKTELTKAVMAKVGSTCGFVDWAGLRLEHSLRRKRLRPVYE